jgi:hypothetical protein
LIHLTYTYMYIYTYIHTYIHKQEYMHTFLFIFWNVFTLGKALLDPFSTNQYSALLSYAITNPLYNSPIYILIFVNIYLYLCIFICIYTHIDIYYTNIYDTLAGCHIVLVIHFITQLFTWYMNMCINTCAYMYISISTCLHVYNM